MTNSSWSKCSPEWHCDEAQRLSEQARAPGHSDSEALWCLKIAHVHAMLAVAKMTDRLDSTVNELMKVMERGVI